MKSFKYIVFNNCEICLGEGVEVGYCPECRGRSEYEYENYLEGKREDALEEMRDYKEKQNESK